MNKILIAGLMLVISNVFMTYAWYGHLRFFKTNPWFIAAFISWLIAFFEYMVQVPANRIGYGAADLSQLKIMQEVITLGVFIPFSIFVMKEKIRLDFIYACLCLIGAVYFIFRNKIGS